MRGLRLSILLALAAALVAGVAAADHWWKHGRVNSAELREWHCTYDGTLCGGPSSAAIERHWNQRELAYELLVTGLLATAATVAVHRIDRRWRGA